jgi:transposase-like protein
MMTQISYSGYRFPPEIIQQAIWLYVRFTLSFRDVEDLLAERGIFVSYETVRRWVNHFGPMIAADLRKRREKAAIVRVIHQEPAFSEMFCPSSGPDHPRRSRPRRSAVQFE